MPGPYAEPGPAAAATRAAIAAGARPGSPYLWLAAALAATAFAGFSLTYFTPLAAGRYPDVSPAVHVHGWSFFLWYLLLPLQAVLIRGRRDRMHRRLGAMSVGLACLMVLTGVLVLGTRVDNALRTGNDPFWSFMGLAIFASLVLFAAFHVQALTAQATSRLSQALHHPGERRWPGGRDVPNRRRGPRVRSRIWPGSAASWRHSTRPARDRVICAA